MPRVLLIAHNLRSCHNVGSLLRTAEGLGIEKVYLTGYTPYPLAPKDERLPHLANKINRQIHKTALGAEEMQSWQQTEDLPALLVSLRADGYAIVALEQSSTSIKLPDLQPPKKMALLVGREVQGVEPEVLAVCDSIVEIPMRGQKESFNVTQAAAMALFHCMYSK